MKDEQANQLIETVREHGNQLGSNLAFLKQFLSHLQKEQHAFLAEQRQITEKAQRRANAAAIFSAIAAGAAAVAAIIQALDAFMAP